VVVSYSWDQVIAWLGIVVPLFALAYAAVQHVSNERVQRQYRQFQKFHELMKELGSPNSTLLGNVAIAYELRKFPEYREIITRCLPDVPVGGSGAEMLKNEFRLTISHLEKS
jgi:hypothetical protein